MASINERFMDFQVAQQVRWIRLANRDVQEALKILNRVDKQLEAAIRAADIETGVFTKARTEALRAQVKNLINDLHTKQLSPAMISSMEEAAVLSGSLEAKLFKQHLPAGLDVTTPNLGVLQMAASLKPFNGAVMADWVKQLRVADLNRTWASILDGITSGTTTDDLIKQVVGTKSLSYKDGVREVSRRGAEALVRTSINHATNQGRDLVWQDNSDIIAGIRWVSTLDGRTTPICQYRDGRVGPPPGASKDWTVPGGAEPLVPPFARPPAHPNCRSTTVAVLKSWKQLGFNVDELSPGTRASMDGQVPSNVTYGEWLKKQPGDIQEEILGPARYKMYRGGQVPMDKFINDKGEYLTLDKLRTKFDIPAPPKAPPPAPKPDPALAKLEGWISNIARGTPDILKTSLEDIAARARAGALSEADVTAVKTYDQIMHAFLRPPWKPDAALIRGMKDTMEEARRLKSSVGDTIVSKLQGLIEISRERDLTIDEATQLGQIRTKLVAEKDRIHELEIAGTPSADKASEATQAAEAMTKERASTFGVLPEPDPRLLDILQKLPIEELTVDEGTTTASAIEDYIRTKMGEADAFIRVTRRNLSKIMKDGRFKSQFEARASGGAFAPEMRSRLERLLMGVPEDVAPPERPIYGYFSDHPAGKAPEVDHYGDIAVKLKPGVKERATVTLGDSLDLNSIYRLSDAEIDAGRFKNWYLQTLPSPATKPLFRSVPTQYGDLSRWLDHLDKTVSFAENTRAYWEGQFYGGVRLDDIQEVFFTGKKLGETGPGPGLKSMLKKHGIKWSIVD